ncbi:MAG: LysR family transcriptional regulator [Actinomycetota bacterium]|nr:MAG: LysR family transcriptional regulator [Actinomycetota bacterium]
MTILARFIRKLYDSIVRDHELVWFIKLAETQHVTWTADEMDITQPTLSRAISRLENELGVSLFSRVGRRLELNEYGKLFYKYARSAVTELEIGKQQVAELASLAAQHIRMGTLHGLVPILIQALVEPFHTRSPATTFYFRLGSPRDILDELELGHLDFILTTTKPDKNEKNWIRVAKQVFYLAVGPGHALADKTKAYLSEVASDDFIVMRSGTAMRNLTTSLCHQAGFTPNIVLESNEIAAIRSLVAYGIGVAIIPKAYTTREPENVTYLDIRDDGIRNFRDIDLVWKSSGSRIPMLNTFLDFALETFGDETRPDLR